MTAARLHGLWKARSPAERLAMIVMAAFVATVLYVWLVQSAMQARTRLTAAVTTLQSQTLQMEQQSVEHAKLLAAPALPPADTDLRTLVQSQIDTAGLSQSLLKLDVQDTQRVRVTFGSAVFTDWLEWVQAMQTQRVRIETCRIEALSTTGLVSITAMLVRDQSR